MQTEKTKSSTFDVLALICSWGLVVVSIYDHNWLAFAGWFTASCYKTAMMIDE